MTRTALRVALLGAGTVGREVARAFESFPDRLAVHGGPRLALAGIAVRDLDRARRSGLPPELLTDAPAHLVAAPDTDVVVEVMGGDEPARTLIAAALAAGKPVVTANKHVIAHHGAELEAIARSTGATFRFEAAVGGGIPILGPLAADLAANRVSRVRGIVNGSTNLILSRMASDGGAYADILAEAQAAGFLEADPSADVEGTDAVNKLVILIRLAFGVWVDPTAIVRRPPVVGAGTGPAPGGVPGRPGITGIRAIDIAAAAALGSAIRLVADARRLDDGRIAASVLPTLVPLADPLGRTAGAMNRIEVRADPIGSVAMSGPGAGGAATSSAVLGDLIAVARGAGSTWAGLAPASRAQDGVLVGPPDAAPDRGWFAVVPGAAPADLAAMAGDGVAAMAGVRVVALDGGTAIHVPRVALEVVRASLAGAGVPPNEAILPADEPAPRS
ncbi:MAG: homoserine dehydrogenase [Chloroflexi bacterium]|nr:homoserine dehydrogenase [Chloroflexota bacterium]